MSPSQDYVDEGQAVVNAAQEIKKAIQEHGFGTAATMVILSELLKMTQVAGTFASLPQTEKDEFFGEIFDAAIGSEPNALVTKVGIFEGETLEKMSDAIKAGALAYFNRQIPQA